MYPSKWFAQPLQNISASVINHTVYRVDDDMVKKPRITCGELSRILSSLTIPIEDEQRDTCGGHISWRLASDIDGEVHVDIRNLTIAIAADFDDSTFDDSTHDWFDEISYGFSGLCTVLHFENCHFEIVDVWKQGIRFASALTKSDWHERLTFSKNTGNCNFAFLTNSDVSVLFLLNDFGRISATSNKSIDLAFIGNKIDRLTFDFEFPFMYSINCRFNGDNKIRSLTWDQMVNRASDGGIARFDDLQEYSLFSVSFERSDRIGEGLSHRRSNEISVMDLSDMEALLIRFRNIAQMRGNTSQVRFITSYISLIEYISLKIVPWYTDWSSCQDWLMLSWRYKSSRFYSSLLRPLAYMISGFFFLNAIPFLYFCYHGLSFDFIRYLEFCFSSPTKVPFYSDNLAEILGEDKFGELLWGVNKAWLGFLGIFRLTWLILFGYAFRNALKMYEQK